VVKLDTLPIDVQWEKSPKEIEVKTPNHRKRMKKWK